MNAEKILGYLTPLLPVRSDSPPLLLAVSGFFVYPTAGQTTCRTILAPYADRVPHQAHLAVATAAVKYLSPSVHSVETAEGLTLISLDGLVVTPDEGQGTATLVRSSSGKDTDPDFSWIPDIAETYCGLRLDPAAIRSRNLRFRFNLGDGVLGAIPGDKTLTEEWHWVACDGVTTRQRRVTTNAAHLIPSWSSGILRFTSALGQDRGHLALRALPLPVPGLELFAAVLVNTPPDDASLQHDVELDHVEAVMKLCMPDGNPIGVPVKRSTSRDSQPGDGAKPDGPLVSLLDHYVVASSRFAGTPECSGQQGSI